MAVVYDLMIVYCAVIVPASITAEAIIQLADSAHTDKILFTVMYVKTHYYKW